MAFHPSKGKAWHQQRTVKPKEARTSSDGILHPSGSHRLRWDKLRVKQDLGEITNLTREVSFPLLVEGRPIKTRTGRTSKYTADFVYKLAGDSKWVIEEHKGYLDELSRFRIATFEACYNVTVYFHKEKSSTRLKKEVAKSDLFQ